MGHPYTQGHEPITGTEAATIIRTHGLNPGDFWADRAVALQVDRDPMPEQRWAMDCAWLREEQVTRQMVAYWLGY